MYLSIRDTSRIKISVNQQQITLLQPTGDNADCNQNICSIDRTIRKAQRRNISVIVMKT